MYTDEWVRRRYMAQLAKEVEDMIENGDIDPDIADNYYTEKLEELDAEYGDYLYDMMGDR